MSDQPQLPPGLPLTVTLSVTQWRTVLTTLGEGPFRIVGPLIGEIERQCQPQLQAAVRGNGVAEHPDA